MSRFIYSESMPSEQSDQKRPVWTLSEAAERCQVSRSTVRRYREQGRFPNAVKDSKKGWMVPLTDLLGAGLDPATPPAQEEPTPLLSEQAQSESEHALELAQLRAALDVERAQRQAAEQIAAERQDHIDDLRASLRMIEAAKPAVPEQIQVAAQRPRRWWSRK